MRFQKKLRFRLCSRLLAIKLNVWNEELHTHYGITNEVPNTDRFIPFWDFKEDINIMELFGSLRQVQSVYNLTDIHVLQTYPKQSYRAFSFDMMDFQHYIALLSATPFIDLSYLRHSVMRGRAVIRVSEKDGTKNVHIKTLGGDFQARELSRHHQAFFSTIYPQISPPVTMPRPIKVRVSKYETFR